MSKYTKSKGMTEGEVIRSVIMTRIVESTIERSMNKDEIATFDDLVELLANLNDLLACIAGDCMQVVQDDTALVAKLGNLLDAHKPKGWDIYANTLEEIGRRLADYATAVRQIKAVEPVLERAWEQMQGE